MLKTPSVIPKTRFIQPIAVINQSTVVSDAEAKNVVHAIQVQVTRDFAPAWNMIAELKFYSASDPVPATSWQMVLLDDADQAGALGYHDLTAAGLPLGKVFLKTSAQDKVAWSTTLSHEMLEMIVDPYLDEISLKQNADGTGVLYALEVCDPVEADSYAIGSILVSNFVYPEWFEEYAPNFQKKFDFLGLLQQPFTLTPGGYASTLNLTQPLTWKQIFADGTTKIVKSR